MGYGRRKMELASQTTVVTRVGQRLGDQRRRFVPVVVAVDAGVNRAWIHARKEARSARCADWRLAVRVGERYALRNETVQIRRAYVGISQGVYGVIALLVRAYPQDVGSLPCFTCPQIRPGGQGHA